MLYHMNEIHDSLNLKIVVHCNMAFKSSCNSFTIQHKYYHIVTFRQGLLEKMFNTLKSLLVTSTKNTNLILKLKKKSDKKITI